MTSTPTLRRWLSVAGTGVILAVVVGILMLGRDRPSEAAPRVAKKDANPTWPLWGGTVQRNLVNLFEKNMPTQWSNLPGKEKNILWSVNLGSKAYGGPTIAGNHFPGAERECSRRMRQQEAGQVGAGHDSPPGDARQRRGVPRRVRSRSKCQAVLHGPILRRRIRPHI